MTTEYQRRKMIALSNTGMKAPVIAEQIGCSVWTVRKWVQAYKKKQFGIPYGASKVNSPWQF